MSDNEDGNSKGLSGIYFKATHCLAAFMICVLLVIGVGVLVFFATDSGQSKPYTNQLWDKCNQEAKEKQMCIIPCSPTPEPTQYPTRSSSQAQRTNVSVKPSVTHTFKTHHSTSVPEKKSVHTTIKPPPPINRRLPTDLYPVHYKLYFNPDIYGNDENTFKFDGSLELKFRCDQSTDVITLNSRTLTYIDDSLALMEINGSDIGINSYSFDLLREFIILKPNQRLKAGHQYMLSLNFTGPIKRYVFGIYLSSYTRSDNSTAYIANTLMAINHARKVFPCFDEPAFKSVFQFSILRQSHMHSLSNMEIKETHNMGNAYEMDVYEDTVIMSTYILAFVVSDLVNSTVYVNGTKISVWTRPDFAGQGDYALQIAAKTIPYFGWYLEEPYTLKKLDMFSIPDFIAGAIEQWGLIVFQERNILYDNRTSTASTQLLVAKTVIHEIGHMWFGNLVTLTWWSGTWLNQGFAQYYMYVGTDNAEPSWNRFNLFRIHDTERAMAMDSYKVSHPLEPIVNDATLTGSFLDSIVYSKGAHILKTMRAFMGDENFRKGMILYIKRYKYGSVNRTMLWNAMTDATGIDVASVMETWVAQNNFPVVHIRRLKPNLNDNVSTAVKIRQERFLLKKDGPESEIYTSPYGYKWRIPMTIVSNAPNSSDEGILWLNETKSEQKYELSFKLENKHWILGNPGDNIYCRTNYDESNWRLLVHQLKTDHTKISVLDRSVLIKDACELAKSGYIDITICLDVISYIQAENDFAPLLAALKYIRYINAMLHERPIYREFSRWIKSTMGSLYDRMESDKVTNAIMRYKKALIVAYACLYGHEKCHNDISKTFRKLANNTEADIDPDLIDTIYCYGMKQGTVADWENLYKKREQVPAGHRLAVIKALGCRTCEIWLLTKYLNAGLTEMRTQYLPEVFLTVARSTVGKTIAFNTFRDNWDMIFKRIGKGVFAFSKIIRAVTDSMNTDFELTQVRALMSAHPDHGSGASALTNAVRNIQVNIAWLKINENKIYAWLKRQN